MGYTFNQIESLCHLKDLEGAAKALFGTSNTAEAGTTLDELLIEACLDYDHENHELRIDSEKWFETFDRDLYALAPYMDECELRFIGEDHMMWGFRLVDGQLKEIRGRIVWEVI